MEQVLDHTGQPKLKAGDTVEVVVEREEAEGGYLLSYEKAQRHRVWDAIEKAANDKTPITGIVVGRVKGGLTVDIGIKAFLPGSQLEIRPVRNLDAYIGQPIDVRVIKLNKKRGNVVVSRKEILEEEQTGQAQRRRWSIWKRAAVLTGTVKNLTDYGAFVDLGGIDGLLHITDMSWGRLTHPRDLVNVGRRNPGKGTEVRQGKAAGFPGIQAAHSRPLAGCGGALSHRRPGAWTGAERDRLRLLCRAGAGH